MSRAPANFRSAMKRIWAKDRCADDGYGSTDRNFFRSAVSVSAALLDSASKRSHGPICNFGASRGMEGSPLLSPPNVIFAKKSAAAREEIEQERKLSNARCFTSASSISTLGYCDRFGFGKWVPGCSLSIENLGEGGPLPRPPSSVAPMSTRRTYYPPGHISVDPQGIFHLPGIRLCPTHAIRRLLCNICRSFLIPRLSPRERLRI